MRKILSIITLSFVFSCATYAQSGGLTYIKTDNVNSSSINIINIDEFFQIINENRIRTIFYTDRQFIAQGNSFVYTIDKKGYNDLNDYKDGGNFFKEGDSYYLAKEIGLKNQEEVDYYRKEAFLTISDYKDAVRLGFSPSNFDRRGNIYGLISRENLQKNIRFANSALYLEYYHRWNQQPSSAKRYDGRNKTHVYLYGEEDEYNNSSNRNTSNADLLGNTDVNYLISRSNGAIKKLNNYDYFIINLPILSEKDSFLYYAVKMAQYSDYSDFVNHKGTYSVKNTESILKQLGYNSLDDMTRADSSGINNSADYYLTVHYRIGKNDLENNRILIKEIETIKDRFNLTTVQQAIMVNYILKMPKGVPYSTRVLASKFQQEYRNNALLNAQGGLNETIFPQIFSTAPQLDKFIMYNLEGESLYLK